MGVFVPLSKNARVAALTTLHFLCNLPMDPTS
jgi:hypothetical protein